MAVDSREPGRVPGQGLAALHEVALAVNSSLDVDQVLHVILERACQFLHARKGSILLRDADNHHLTIAVAYGLSDEVVESTRVALGEGIAGAVAQEGTPRRLAPGTRQRDGRSVELPAALCVPLLADARVIGVLNVSDRTDGTEFSDDDLSLALLFAAQSAVAIRNARAFEEQQRQAAELRALQDVAMTVNDNLELGETLSDVLRKATELLGAQRGSLLLLDPEQEVLTIAVAHGLSDEVVETTRVPLGEGIVGEVARTGQPRLLGRGVRAEDSLKEGDRSLPSALCVPLQVVGRTIGVLNVSDRAGGGNFTERDLDFLQALGRQAAMAINNARLYDAVKARAEALSALNTIGRALTGSLERDQVLGRVLQDALRLLDCRKGSLMLIQTEQDEDPPYDPQQPFVEVAGEPERFLQIVVAEGLPEEVVENTRIRLGEGIAGGVAATGEPAVLGQGEVAEGSSSRDRSASLCLPLHAKEQIIGVLNLSDHIAGEFSDEEIELAVTLAAQAATAIENAQLYVDLRDQFVHSIRVIANAIDARDPYTRGHSDRVARYSRLIACEMGLSDDEIETIYYAGLLHDVGKIGIRDNILLKDGKLTDEEFDVMKHHPVKSAEIIYPVKQLRRILPGLRHHHERFSARGYPDGLHEEQIPLMARVIGVADTYDAMTSDRPYRKALPRRVALEELAKNRGSQFDPTCVNAFLELARRGDVGEIDGQGPAGAADVAAALAAAEAARGDVGTT
ncbi:MAG: GAF domain-containing protein [Armatimonadetes bacterium]|nr:GAF domain-containing protein [Armatimonadota bacterium]